METIIGLTIVVTLFILCISLMIANRNLRRTTRHLTKELDEHRTIKSNLDYYINDLKFTESLYPKITPVDYRFKNEHEILQETSPIDYLTK